MFFAVQLPEKWLVSATAKRVYIIAAGSLAAFLLFIVSVISFTVLAGGGLRSATIADTVFAILLIPAVLGTSLLNVAMWYFWVRCHSNDSHSKGLWLLVLWGLSPIGALFYFLFFYLKSPLVRAAPKNQAASASLLNSTA